MLCEPDYYVSGKDCEIRVQSHPNQTQSCVEFYPNEDKCNECEIGYTLNSFKNACLNSIDNCKKLNLDA